MPAFSGLKALGISPRSLEDYYSDDDSTPVGWSTRPYNLFGGAPTNATPHYSDPTKVKQWEAERLARDYQLNRLRNEVQNQPEEDRLASIERQERMKSGLERLKMLGQKQELQNKLQQGQIDYWTPEGRRQLSQAVGMGTLSPSSLQAIRAASPKSEALAEAVYNLHGIDLDSPDANEQLQGIISSTDKSLHLEPEFKYALRDAQHAIARRQLENDKTLINRALESGMDQDEMMKYLNPEMTRVADKASFMKAYGEHLREQKARKQLFTPDWEKKDRELQYQAMDRAAREPDMGTIDNYIMSKDLNRDFAKNPISPQERMLAAQKWKSEPAAELSFRKQAMQKMLDQALGKTPEPQNQPSQISKAEALVNKFTQ